MFAGEKLDDGIKEAYILLANEAIYLQATEEFEDGKEIKSIQQLSPSQLNSVH